MESTSEQRREEFIQLMDRAKARGLSPADMARLIKMTDASISQWIKGPRGPMPAVLDNIRQKVEELENPKLLSQPATTAEELHSQLNDLEKYDPDGFEAAKVTIGVLYSKIVSYKEDSKTKSAGSRLLKKAAKQVSSHDKVVEERANQVSEEHIRRITGARQKASPNPSPKSGPNQPPAGGSGSPSSSGGVHP